MSTDLRSVRCGAAGHLSSTRKVAGLTPAADMSPSEETNPAAELKHMLSTDSPSHVYTFTTTLIPNQDFNSKLPTHPVLYTSSRPKPRTICFQKRWHYSHKPAQLSHTRSCWHTEAISAAATADSAPLKTFTQPGSAFLHCWDNNPQFLIHSSAL